MHDGLLVLFRFDVGPILVQEKFDIPENCTTPQLEKLAAHHGGRLVGLSPPPQKKQVDINGASSYLEPLRNRFVEPLLPIFGMMLVLGFEPMVLLVQL